MSSPGPASFARIMPSRCAAAPVCASSRPGRACILAAADGLDVVADGLGVSLRLRCLAVIFAGAAMQRARQARAEAAIADTVLEDLAHRG
jgi:hypothetical protein